MSDLKRWYLPFDFGGQEMTENAVGNFVRYDDHVRELAKAADTLAAKDTALAEMRVELERLRHTAQSRYELLRECQTELRTLQDNPEGGLVEAIARALGPSLLDEGVKR